MVSCGNFFLNTFLLFHKILTPLILVLATDMLVRLDVESISQNGLTTTFRHFSGEVEPERTWTVDIPAEQRQETGNENLLADFPESSLNLPSEREIWDVIRHYIGPYLAYLTNNLRVLVRRCTFGSLLITLECSSLQVIEGLWEDYCSGHFDVVAQEMLVTTEVLRKLGLTEVKLKAFISKKEYEKGKQVFKDNSGWCKTFN